ncbi:hypothetical protein D3C84_308460 [compost metagenome]
MLHKDFVFADGSVKDKYLVILGGRGGIVVAAKTTSKGHRYRNDHGCQSGSYYPAFLLTVGCCCLKLNSWICLGDFYEIDEGRLLQGVVAGNIFRQGYLEDGLTRDVQFCAKECDDITVYQESIINASLVQVP